MISCESLVKKGLALQTQKNSNELSKDFKLLQQVENYYQKALRICPDICLKQPELCSNMGIIYQYQGKTDLAESMFKKALSYDPKIESACIHLAQIYEQKQLYVLALKYYLNAIELNPLNHDAFKQAKTIATNYNCKGTTVKDNDILSDTQLYNSMACTRIFNRAKKHFSITRSIYVAPVNFWNIFFDLGSATLKTKSFPQLNYIVKMMKDNGKFNLTINGHTDDLPVNRRLEVLDNTFCHDNQCLSEYRAISVKKYLNQRGIKGERMKTKGFADARPYNINERALNRRVEIVDMDFAQ